MAGQDVQTNVVLTADNSQYDQSMMSSAQTTDGLGKSVDALSDKLNKLTKSAGRKLIGVSAADTAALGATTLAYGAWEKQMSRLNAQAAILNKTVAGQNQTFKGYADSVSHLRSEFGMATSEAAELTQTIVKLTGLPSTGVDKLAQTFATMGTATGESSAALANSVLQLQKTMGTQPGRETERYANQLSVLASSTGTSATALADFAQQIAPVARQVGTSQTEVQGLSAAFAKAGQDGYQAMGFYTRMMNDVSYAAQSGSPRLNQFAALAGQTTKQFKDSSGIEQFNNILNALNKQGPSAINTLNQLGYEGNRMSKVALTLSQQGGIMGAIGQAKAADRDPGAMSRGSEAAMNNLYDSMSKLRIELTKTAESFGKFWAGPASTFFKGLTMAAHVMQELASSPLGQFAAMVTGLVAPLVALAGALMLTVKAIGMFALARGMLTGAAASGFKETAALSTEARAAMAGQGFVPGVGPGRMSVGRVGAQIAETPRWGQRLAYNTASDIARMTGYQTGQAGTLVRTVGGVGAYGAGRLVEGAVQPQFAAASMSTPGFRGVTGGYNDVTRRMPFFRSATARESFGMGPTGPLTRGWQSFREGWRLGDPGAASAAASAAPVAGPVATAQTGGFMGQMRAAATRGWTGVQQLVPPAGPGLTTETKTSEGTKARIMGLGKPAEETEKAVTAAEKNIKAVEASEQAAARFARTTALADRGMGVFGRSMINTTATIASAGAGMVRFGAGLGRQAFALAGGNPLLLAGGGIFAAMQMAKAYSADTKLGSHPRTGFADTYLEAAGLSTLPGGAGAQAAAATSKTQTMRQAYTITPTEAAAVRGSQYQVTNPFLKGKTAKDADEIEASLAAQWKYGAQSPQFVAQTAAELSNVLGPTEAMAMMQRLRTGQAKQPYFLATQAAQVGRKGWMDKLGNTLSGSLATPKVDTLTGIIDDTYAQINASQGPEAAAAYRRTALDKSFQAFNAGLASHKGAFGTGIGAPNLDEVKQSFYTGMLKEAGVDKDKIPGDIRDVGTPKTSFEFAKKLILGDAKAGAPAVGYDAFGNKVVAGGGAPIGTLAGVSILGDQGVAATTTGGKSPILSDEDVRDMLSKVGVSEKKLNTLDLGNRQAVLAAYTQQTEGMSPAQKQHQTNVMTQMAALTGGTKAFGAQGILGLPSVNAALVTKMGDPNAMYKAVQQVTQGIASTGGTAVQGIGKTLDMLRTAQGVPGAGSEMLMQVLGQQQQSIAMRQPFMSRTQSFAQAANMFQEIQGKPLAGEHGAEIKAQSKADFAASVQDQYNFFKQQLYQQREYNVMRSRAERDYTQQRQYAQEDYNTTREREEEQYNLSRKRAIRDFNTSMNEAQTAYNLQRKRAEEDHAHQVQLMIQQQASAYTNAYERVAVQQVESAQWVTSNINEQTDLINQQSENLNKLRKAGVTNQTIQQLGLNDPAKAQQLKEDLAEIAADPKLAKRMNESVRANIKAAGKLATDDSNQSWKEFERTYKLGLKRGEEDFSTSMTLARKHFKTQLGDMATDYQTMLNQQQQDYAKMMGRQAKAYATSMQDAAHDLARSAKTIDGNFEDILTKATTHLSGHAKDQAEATLSQFDDLNTKAGPKAVALKQYYSDVFGFDWTPPPPISTGDSTPTSANPSHKTGTVGGGADGAIVPGWTPGRDVHTIGVSGGEAIMRPEWVRAVGEETINQLNHQAKYGGFAAGGVFRPIKVPEGRGLHDTNTPFPGIDFPAKVGTPVYAVGDGRVTRSQDIAGPLPSDKYHDPKYGPYGSYGRVMQLQIEGGPEVLYAHLSKRGYARGVRVKGGDPIGLSGSAGNSSGPHLHFGDSDGNPEEFLGGRKGVGTIKGGIVAGVLAASIGSFREVMGKMLKDSYPGIVNAMSRGMGFQFPSPPDAISHDMNRLARLDFIKMRKKAVREGIAPGPDATNAPAHVKGNVALGKNMAAAFGWKGNEWDALYQLWQHESGWNQFADNPNSPAYGIPQSLPGSKMATAGADWKTNPATQIKWGLNYIKNRADYGSPSKAWSLWQQRDPHWYNEGSIFTGPKEIGVGEGGAEMVLPLNHRGTDFLAELMKKHTADGRGMGLGSTPLSGGVSVMNYRIDRSTTFAGDIHVHANDPNELISKLQARNRLQALTRPSTAGSAA